MMTEGERKTVLVAGGAGYIGSHVCKALAAAGFRPVCFDNLSSGHNWAVQWGPLELGDVLDRAKIDTVIAKHKPVAVLHFAESSQASESIAKPGKYYRNNVSGSLTLLDAMRERGVKHFVYGSTCATFGNAETSPLREETAQRPISSYGASKLMVERILADFGVAHGLTWSVLRNCNVAGVDVEGRLAKRRDVETHLIPLVLDAAFGRRPNVTIFGTDYETPDGTCIRDFVHVDDIAQAYVAALKAQLQGAPSDIYNLGSGLGVSVRQVVDVAERVTGRKIAVELGRRRAGDAATLVGDANRARNLLGWRPRMSDLADIIRSASTVHQVGLVPTKV